MHSRHYIAMHIDAFGLTICIKMSAMVRGVFNFDDYITNPFVNSALEKVVCWVNNSFFSVMRTELHSLNYLAILKY